jgi:hypothetical protein
VFAKIDGALTLDYTAYYPLYNTETLFTQPNIAQDYRYLSHGSHDIEKRKIRNPTSAIITPNNTLNRCKKKANEIFLVGIVRETLKWGLHPLIHTGLEFRRAQDVEGC